MRSNQGGVRKPSSTFQRVDILCVTSEQLALVVKQLDEMVRWRRLKGAGPQLEAQLVEWSWIAFEKIEFENCMINQMSVSLILAHTPL